MAWDVRGDRRYYYRSQRIGDAVKRVYLGAGAMAEPAARKDAAMKARQAANQAELADFQAMLSGVDQLAAEVQNGVAVLTEAALLAIGYRKHGAEWRMPRRDMETA